MLTYRNENLLVFTAFFVVIFHLVLFFLCYFLSFTSAPFVKNSMQPKHNLRVQTISFTAPTISESASKALQIEPKHEKVISVKINNASNSKKVPVKTSAQKKSTKIQPSKLNTNEQQKSRNTVKEKLLKEAEEKLNKIQSLSSSLNNSKSELVAASQLKNSTDLKELKSDAIALTAGFGREILDYQDHLMSRLRSLLKMPEYGDVKIEITLTRLGKIAKLRVLHDESRKNRLYVEKVLPTLILPSFGSFFGDEKTKTFVMTLTNDL